MAHGSSDLVRRSEVPMSGSATFTTVTSRTSMSCATDSSASAVRRLPSGVRAAWRPARVTDAEVIVSPLLDKPYRHVRIPRDRRYHVTRTGQYDFLWAGVAEASGGMAHPRNGRSPPTEGRPPARMPPGTRTNQPASSAEAQAQAPARAGQPRRADAKRNVAAILAAAAECLARNPDTSMGEIAAAAGVGRMTLYGHFKTRAELLNAVLTQVIAEAHDALDAVDVSGDPRDALARLVAANWLVVDRLRLVLEAAPRELPAERIHHAPA